MIDVRENALPVLKVLPLKTNRLELILPVTLTVIHMYMYIYLKNRLH